MTQKNISIAVPIIKSTKNHIKLNLNQNGFGWVNSRHLIFIQNVLMFKHLVSYDVDFS